MKAETMIQWMAALLGGDYSQGRRALRTKDDKYCCLGVLCDVVKDSPEVKGSWRQVPADYGSNAGWEFKFKDLTDKSLIPHELASKLGVDGVQSVLAARNDRGQRFKRIAELIPVLIQVDDEQGEQEAA